LIVEQKNYETRVRRKMMRSKEKLMGRSRKRMIRIDETSTG